MNSGEIIELNVSGTRMTTTRSTLTARAGSKLAKALTSGELPVDGECRFLIDRDPASFMTILNYLRLYKAAQVWETALPKDPDRLALLTQESEHWGLTALRDAAVRLLRSAADPNDAGYFNQVLVQSKSFHLDLSKSDSGH